MSYCHRTKCPCYVPTGSELTVCGSHHWMTQNLYNSFLTFPLRLIVYRYSSSINVKHRRLGGWGGGGIKVFQYLNLQDISCLLSQDLSLVSVISPSLNPIILILLSNNNNNITTTLIPENEKDQSDRMWPLMFHLTLKHHHSGD